MPQLNHQKIALALGSGGARGLAHIGVIKVLEENNIPIDFIAGSSIGSLVGGFYASGLDIKKIEEIALGTNLRRMFSWIDPHLKQGLIGGKKIKTFIESCIGNKKIEDCKIPFVAVATDLKTGEAVILNKGEMSEAIMASIAVPLVFKPVRIGSRTLSDGALSVPIPVEIARRMGADLVIAVNLDKHYHDEEWTPGWYDMANDSINIMRYHMSLSNISNADIVIDVDLGKNYWYDFTNGKDKILTGEKATREVIPKLQQIIHQKDVRGLRRFLRFFRG